MAVLADSWIASVAGMNPLDCKETSIATGLRAHIVEVAEEWMVCGSRSADAEQLAVPDVARNETAETAGGWSSHKIGSWA